MNIFVFNDGRLVITQPGEELNMKLEDLAVCITNPQEGEVLMNDGNMWVNKPLPEPEEDTEPGAEQTQGGEE